MSRAWAGGPGTRVAAILWLAIAPVVAVASGCGSSASTSDAGAAPASRTDAAGGVPDASLDLPTSPSTEPDPTVLDKPDVIRRSDGPPAQTCGDLRNCVAACQADSGCIQRCVDSAAAAARTQYQMTDMCRLKYCKPDDINCRCDQECISDGNCFDEVDSCRNFENDVFCDELCR